MSNNSKAVASARGNGKAQAPVAQAPVAQAPVAQAPVAQAPVDPAEAWAKAEAEQLAANLAAKAEADAKAAAAAVSAKRQLSPAMAKLLAMAQSKGVTTADMKATLTMKAAPPQTQVMARLAKQVDGVVASVPAGRGNAWLVVAPGGVLPPNATIHPAYRAHAAVPTLRREAAQAK